MAYLSGAFFTWDTSNYVEFSKLSDPTDFSSLPPDEDVREVVGLVEIDDSDLLSAEDIFIFEPDDVYFFIPDGGTA